MWGLFLAKYCKEYKIKGKSDRRKDGRMNFYDKKTRRLISIIIVVVILAMVATMIIPYLV